MQAFTDQTGHTIFLDNTPTRIISLVPSQTELLFDLGLDEQVVGITKFCVYPPEWFYMKKRVGGTKQLRFDIIHQLQPDLIIANKEENVKEQVEELSPDYPVWTSDVTDLPTAQVVASTLQLFVHRVEDRSSYRAPLGRARRLDAGLRPPLDRGRRGPGRRPGMDRPRGRPGTVLPRHI